MIIRREKIDVLIFILGLGLFGLIFALTSQAYTSYADEDGPQVDLSSSNDASKHFITIYDHGDGSTLTLRTDADTVEGVLERAKISLETGDIVEPALIEAITSAHFRINIYRAQPAIVIDGIRQYKVMTAATDPAEIAKAAGIELLEADVVKVTTTDNFIETGLPIAYRVIRAKSINFNFYGQLMTLRTATNTIEGFLNERQIDITASDWLSLPIHTPVTDGLELSLFRQGKNTLTIDEEIPFTEQYTHDYSFNLGYRAITQAGQTGRKTVTYEVEMVDGQELYRAAISEVVSEEPQAQLVTLGARAISMKALTKEMGRNRYTTSTGILREETYYDLPMKGVLGFCGATSYSVRADGAKVDPDGFVLVAANLNRYPRCSIVETSLGLGKVYDTGGFAAHNPEQFDLATDWTNRDGI